MSFRPLMSEWKLVYWSNYYYFTYEWVKTRVYIGQRFILLFVYHGLVVVTLALLVRERVFLVRGCAWGARRRWRAWRFPGVMFLWFHFLHPGPLPSLLLLDHDLVDPWRLSTAHDGYDFVELVVEVRVTARPKRKIWRFIDR